MPRSTLTTPLRLRPGLAVVRRDRQHLQIGVEPPLCAVVPDEPGVRRLLESLQRGETAIPRTAPARRALDLLVATDLVVDADLAAEWPALSARYGASAGARRVRRAALVVALDAPPELTGALAQLLRTAGLALGPLEEAAVALVADHGLVRRERVDQLLRADLPHLVVQGGPTAWTVGPFVAPGTTACLRCLDAVVSEADPRYAHLVEQAAGTAAPADPLLRSLALTSAVADLAAYADGERPLTWAATLTIGDGLPRHRPVARHRHCGCSWGAVA